MLILQINSCAPARVLAVPLATRERLGPVGPQDAQGLSCRRILQIGSRALLRSEEVQL